MLVTDCRARAAPDIVVNELCPCIGILATALSWSHVHRVNKARLSPIKAMRIYTIYGSTVDLDGRRLQKLNGAGRSVVWRVTAEPNPILLFHQLLLVHDFGSALVVTVDEEVMNNRTNPDILASIVQQFAVLVDQPIHGQRGDAVDFCHSLECSQKADVQIADRRKIAMLAGIERKELDHCDTSFHRPNEPGEALTHIVPGRDLPSFLDHKHRAFAIEENDVGTVIPDEVIDRGGVGPPLAEQDILGRS